MLASVEEEQVEYRQAISPVHQQRLCTVVILKYTHKTPLCVSADEKYLLETLLAGEAQWKLCLPFTFQSYVGLRLLPVRS